MERVQMHGGSYCSTANILQHESQRCDLKTVDFPCVMITDRNFTVNHENIYMTNEIPAVMHNMYIFFQPTHASHNLFLCTPEVKKG